MKALAEGMARLGHEVHVVASRYGAEGRPKEETVNGVHVHRVRSIRLGYPDLTYPLEYPIDLLKSADVVHGHSQNSLFTVKMIEKAKKLGARTVIHFMAVDALYEHPNPLVRSLGPLYGRQAVLGAIKSSDEHSRQGGARINRCDNRPRRSKATQGADRRARGREEHGDHKLRHQGGENRRARRIHYTGPPER